MVTMFVLVLVNTIISFMTFMVALVFFSRLERGVQDE